MQAVDALMATTDDKLENFIVRSDYSIVKVDREQSLGWYYDDPVPEVDNLSQLDPRYQDNPRLRQAYLQGVRRVITQAREKQTELSELFRRNTNFGVATDQGVVSPLKFEEMQERLGKIEAWLEQMKY